MTNADRFQQVFGLFATEVWAFSEKDFLNWLNEESSLDDDTYDITIHCESKEEHDKVKKGKWHVIKGTGLASCDCGYITDRYSIYDFCPVCGAKNKR